MTVVLFKTM